MNRRAIPALALLIVAVAAIVIAGRDGGEVPEPYFATPAGLWMPHVDDDGVLTGSWFCPGVPVTGEDGVGGEVVISNRDDEEIVGRFSVFGPDGLQTTQSITVEPWSQAVIDVGEHATAAFASVVVEIDGGRGFVEQVARHPAGDSVAACASNTSAEWFFADGFTVDGSVETLLLTNPYEDAAVVDLAFATTSGEASPAAFQGYTIPAQTMETITIAELGARDEEVIAVRVAAQRGRFVLGRAQHYLGGGRLGYDVSLAAPALRDQFWFADGETGPGITETFAIYNPTDADVDVDVVFLGLPLDAGFTDVPTIPVPARGVAVFDPAELGEEGGTALPDGRHATVFSTLSEPRIVVERVLTRPAGNSVATSVLVGAPPRSDGYVASQWHLGIGPSEPTDDALVVYNIDNVDGTVSISAVGPAGPTQVDSLTDISIEAGAVLTIDLVDPDVIGRELIIESTNRVFVERSLPRGGTLSGRSSSWALPASGS